MTLAAMALAAAFLAVMNPALAQPATGAPGRPQLPGFGGKAGASAEVFGDSRDNVHVSVFPMNAKVAPGGETAFAIIFDIDPGWHIWANARQLPAEFATFDGAIYTQIEVTSPASAAFKAYGDLIQWPALHKVRADVGEGPQDYAVFEGKAIAYLPVMIDPTALPGKASFDLLIKIQSCNEKTCAQPADVEMKVGFEIVDAASLPSGTAATPPANPTFAAFDQGVFAKIKSGGARAIPTPATSPGAGSTAGTAKPSGPSGSTGGGATFFGIGLPSFTGTFGYLVLILLSMLGGLILNLTPCVLPIIPIKILTISQHAKTPGKSLYLGLWMAAGVVAFWAGIGVPAALFTSAADPSRIFGIWWVTLGIGLLIAVMGVGIMGLFTIQLPAAVYSVNPKADSAWGSFLFGIMTAVLGLPCFGFVAGALLAGAASLPPAVITLIFTSIGIGMALPYIVLSAKPKLLDRIPRTGPASELVKQVMGLLLLAAGAYFAGSGLISLVIEEPYLGRELHWWVVAAFAALAGLWLVIRTFQITRSPARRAVFTLIGLILAVGALAFAMDVTAKAKSEWLARHGVDQMTDAYVAGAWNDYTPARFAKARAAGEIVVLDFTASWCLTCKVLKATVLDPDPVKTAFAGKDVVVFTVDLTSRKDPGWDFLRSLGQTGIPTLAVYTPGKETPWIANAYTPDQVITALDDARASRIASK